MVIHSNAFPLLHVFSRYCSLLLLSSLFHSFGASIFTPTEQKKIMKNDGRKAFQTWFRARKYSGLLWNRTKGRIGSQQQCNIIKQKRRMHRRVNYTFCCSLQYDKQKICIRWDGQNRSPSCLGHQGGQSWESSLHFRPIKNILDPFLPYSLQHSLPLAQAWN